MVLRALAKLLYLLIIRAGLWAAVLFASAYGILTVATDLPFSGVGMGVGCVIAWVLGLTANIALYKRKHPAEQRTTMKEVRRREPDVRIRRPTEPDSPAREYPADDERDPAPTEKPAAPRPSIDERTLAEKYDLQSYVSPADTAVPESSAAPTDKPDAGVSPKTAAYAPADAEEIFRAERDRLWERLEGERAKRNAGRADEPDRAKKKRGEDDEQERPYAYASRTDPHLYIYEYSDRLEYYRRMGDEMILTSTEYKTEGQNRAVR